MMRPQQIVLVLVLLGCVAAMAAEPTTPPAPPSVLPAQFAGWQAKEIAKSTDPAGADLANAIVLKEYGFQRLEKATYTREDGRTLAIKAAVFVDTSGAYGAFTFYKTPAMLNERIGAQASSLNTRVLFYQGNVLVDAVFDKLTVMSAAELRELAGLLPKPGGNAGNLPTLPTYLPKEAYGYEKNTAKYILGPATLDRVGAALPSAMVDFKSGAEVIIGKYATATGDATLMIIAYPTPQIAAEKLRQIDAAHQVNATPQPDVAPIVDVGPFYDKRTGPYIVIASGSISQKEAQALLASISYEANVTWNEKTYFSKKDNLANLLFNIFVLCGIVLGLAVVAGVAFGGVRIVVKRLFPDRVFDRPEHYEIISLHLSESVEHARGRR